MLILITLIINCDFCFFYFYFLLYLLLYDHACIDYALIDWLLIWNYLNECNEEWLKFCVSFMVCLTFVSLRLWVYLLQKGRKQTKSKLLFYRDCFATMLTFVNEMMCNYYVSSYLNGFAPKIQENAVILKSYFFCVFVSKNSLRTFANSKIKQM